MKSCGDLIILRPYGTVLDRPVEGRLVPTGEFPCLIEALKQGNERRVGVDGDCGMRSFRATAFLREIGIENAFFMAGGIDAWSTNIDPDLPKY